MLMMMMVMSTNDIRKDTMHYAVCTCSPPNEKLSIRYLNQISTMALIFMMTTYFRQDIWMNIWVQFHFQYIFEGRDDFIQTRHIIVPPQIDCCKLDPSKKHKTCGDELNTIL